MGDQCLMEMANCLDETETKMVKWTRSSRATAQIHQAHWRSLQADGVKEVCEEEPTPVLVLYFGSA